MASLRQIRAQIRSIQNIGKITRAMEMVSASKLKRAQSRLFAVRQVTQYLATLMERVAPALAAAQYPLTPPPVGGRSSSDRAMQRSRPLVGPTGGGVTRPAMEHPKQLVIILGSDTGLCGSYNERLMDAALQVLERARRDTASVAVVGKRTERMLRLSAEALAKAGRTPYTVVERWLGWAGRPDPARATLIREYALAQFRDGAADVVSCAYMRFKSSMSYVPTIEQLLPIAVPTANDIAYPIDYIYEPTKERALAAVLEEWLRLKVWVTLLEAFTSEHSARMITMRNATDNAGELVGELTLTRNKVRQAGITRELADIVGTAEALK